MLARKSQKNTVQLEDYTSVVNLQSHNKLTAFHKNKNNNSMFYCTQLGLVALGIPNFRMVIVHIGCRGMHNAMSAEIMFYNYN